MEKGWISLHRKIQECWIWADSEPFDKRSAWIDIILMANHADKKIMFDGKFVTVKAGQRITSIRQLAARWHWSVNKVRRFLDVLERDGMLIKECNKKRTLLTVVNYGVYQVQGHSDGTLTDTQTEQSRHINNNENNENNNNMSDFDSEFERIYKLYPKKRSGKKKARRFYQAWVTTGRKFGGKTYKLTKEQVAAAVLRYINSKQGEENLDYWKNIDTLFGESLLDYVEAEETDES